MYLIHFITINQGVKETGVVGNYKECMRINCENADRLEIPGEMMFMKKLIMKQTDFENIFNE